MNNSGYKFLTGGTMHIIRVILLAFCFHGISFSSESFIPPSIREMAAQMSMVGFRDSEINQDSSILHDVSQGYVANVILFDIDMTANASLRNIRTPDQLNRLITTLKKASGNNLWIGIDQEGGKVQRLKVDYGFTNNYPTAKELGSRDEEYTYKIAKDIGCELKEYGFDHCTRLKIRSFDITY